MVISKTSASTRASPSTAPAASRRPSRFWLANHEWRRSMYDRSRLRCVAVRKFSIMVATMMKAGILAASGSEKDIIDLEYLIVAGGGEFELLSSSQNQETDEFSTKPISLPHIKNKGACICFPSYTYHRVTPVTSGIRKSLIVWFRGPKWI